MSEHVTEWLGIYLDGELDGRRRHQVEEHLEKCAACRAELAELRSLSNVLQETSPAESAMRADRFAANLVLQLHARETAGSLPRHAPAPQPSPSLGAAWWLVPALLLAAWVSFQVFLNTSTLALLAGRAGLFGNVASWLPGGVGETAWYSASLSLFGSQLNSSGRDLLDGLNVVSLLSSSFIIQFAWQAGVALLDLGWLAFWLRRRPPVKAADRLQTPFRS